LNTKAAVVAEAHDTKTVHIKCVLYDNSRKWNSGARCMLWLSL